MKQRNSLNRKKYQTLETVREVATSNAVGIKFINGVSNKYEDQFPSSLEGLVDREKYMAHMEQINRKVAQYWPCCFAYYCGYLCSPCTLGLSLLVPNVCIADAEQILKKQINKMNINVLHNAKMEMRLVKQCYNSKLLIEERDFEQFDMSNDFAYL